MAQVSGDGETSLDLLWAAIAGLRADVARLTGRLERERPMEHGATIRAMRDGDYVPMIFEATQDGLRAALDYVGTGKAEETAEAWRKVRQEELDRMLKQREAQGKGEELEPDDIEALGSEWMNR